jgi:predicted transcriptional regulator of viral defense system
VKEITGLAPKSARNFAATLVQRGIATRLKAGLFILVPFELGRERVYLGNPYLVARELAAGRPYFVSHASAQALARSDPGVLARRDPPIMHGCPDVVRAGSVVVGSFLTFE